MNIYGKIYLVRKHQGDYDEYRMENLAAFKTKEIAERHVERLKALYSKLHEFYYSRRKEMIEEYGIHYGMPMDVFVKYDVYADRENEYYGCEFDVEEVELRRFHR